MFTGIISSVGRVESLVLCEGGARLRLRARLRGGALRLGESIAVDGICLTVARRGAGGFEADLTGETLARTSARTWRRGRRVNLERALSATDRLGGHLVQGHVDGIGKVIFARAGRGQITLRVEFPSELAPLIAEKGSIAIDGISLTVSSLGESWLEVALVPFTIAETSVSDRRPGDPVNVEVDVIARYTARLLQTVRDPRSGRGRTRKDIGGRARGTVRNPRN